MKKFKEPGPRLIFWELTKKCNLNCIHCRAEADNNHFPGELSFDQVCGVVNNISEHYDPIIVLTGGEPLEREDLFDIALYCKQKKITTALATNGTAITPGVASKIKTSGIERVSISIDSSDKEKHDRFRGVDGAFDSSMVGISLLKKEKISFQLNVTITRSNYKELNSIVDLALSEHASAVHFFVLVPVGCGLEIVKDQMLSPEEIEIVLNEIAGLSHGAPIDIKSTCAPHYQRILRQNLSTNEVGNSMAHSTGGCLAGAGVCFISNKGDVQPCGYLPLVAGNVLQRPFNEIWSSSELFSNLRDKALLKGKCGGCEYKNICGGCRARAYYSFKDYLEEEPFCTYIPKKVKNQSC